MEGGNLELFGDFKSERPPPTELELLMESLENKSLDLSKTST